ncbi:hypothetical protein WJX72_009638 [[Myrmecia] bisecta]|uniref:Uncharacterized protein n=1 Tax=[Myrmecia] bisecta TaxID=41462 RepID=A0AAW1Q3E2_9CHLO
MQRTSGSSYSSIESDKLADSAPSSTSGRPMLPDYAGELRLNGASGPRRVLFSHASHQARDPFADVQILEVDSQHIFAAVLTSRAAALGDQYLRRNFHRELLKQIKVQGGNIAKAFKVSMANMDSAFRSLHPFNSTILDGVQLTAAYVDLTDNKLYMAGNGECGCVVGSTNSQGDVEVVAEIGLARLPDHDAHQAGITTVQLTEAVDTIILGSQGYWREMAPKKALLRLQHHQESTPAANGGNASAHLVNFALHAVTQRTRRQKDPRMRSLRSVTNLQSLWKGDKSNFKWGGRQPLRRRAGDVHGDISIISLRLDWQDAEAGTPKVRRSVSKRLRLGLAKLGSPSSKAATASHASAAQHWDLLRMHFLHHALDSRRDTRQMWYAAVERALVQHRQQREQEQAVEAAQLLKESLSDAAAALKVPALSQAPPVSPLVKAC